MRARDLIDVLVTLDDDVEVWVPYGDEPYEEDRVTGAVILYDRTLLLTATRSHHQMAYGNVLWEEENQERKET